MESAVLALRSELREHGIPLSLYTGGEMDLEMLTSLDDDVVRRFAIGDAQRYILIETPYSGWPLDLGERLFTLQLHGFSPILAHPERNDAVQERPALAWDLADKGILLQLTAGSIVGVFGRRARDAALAIIRRGSCHIVAGDWHSASGRPGLAESVLALRKRDGARRMIEEVPALVLAGESIQAAPPKRRFRR